MSPQVTKEVTFYRTKADWERELKRSRCKNWRLSDANLNYEFSQYLNQTIIVPSSVEDVLIKRAAEHFNNSFCPVWVMSFNNHTHDLFFYLILKSICLTSLLQWCQSPR